MWVVDRNRLHTENKPKEALGPTMLDVDGLLYDFRSSKLSGRGRFIQLRGQNGLDAYNPSSSFLQEGRSYCYVRLEPRHDELDSWTALAYHASDTQWELCSHHLMWRLQDPSVQVIQGELVVGGVRILARAEGRVVFETVFLRGESHDSLTEFARGPRNMKDIRLVNLMDGRIGVFTRPVGGEAGRGKVGYTEIDSLADLTPEVMQSAPWIDVQPVEDQWWGINHACALSNSHLGVLAHIAALDGCNRRYYPVAMVYDRIERRVVRGPKILAERAQFPDHPAKRPDLNDVLFPSWFDAQRSLLYTGVADTTIGAIEIDDPFA